MIYQRIAAFCTLGIELGLETTKLECFGVSGYTAELVFWIALPFIVLPFAMIGAFCWLKLQRQSAGLIAVLEKATPPSLQFLFLMYPVLTRKAFRAFPCYVFDTGVSFLRADVAIECGTEAHTLAQSMATLAILLYPIGQLIVFALLLLASRKAITSERPSRLSTAISFLHREYQARFYWWEVRNRSINPMDLQQLTAPPQKLTAPA